MSVREEQIKTLRQRIEREKENIAKYQESTVLSEKAIRECHLLIDELSTREKGD